eukprot:30935-Pelagococcus_subviridis.AAC.24
MLELTAFHSTRRVGAPDALVGSPGVFSAIEAPAAITRAKSALLSMRFRRTPVTDCTVSDTSFIGEMSS